MVVGWERSINWFLDGLVLIEYFSVLNGLFIWWKIEEMVVGEKREDGSIVVWVVYVIISWCVDLCCLWMFCFSDDKFVDEIGYVIYLVLVYLFVLLFGRWSGFFFYGCGCGGDLFVI